jgi:hypothetical protein
VQAQDKGTFKTVSDKEHSETITAYMQGQGQQTIAKAKDRSTRTISVQHHPAQFSRTKNRLLSKLQTDQHQIFLCGS